MKTFHRTSTLALTASLLALAVSVNAQSDLEHYYQFSTGTANDQVGTANGTLQGGASITGGALVTAGNNGGTSGQWGGTGPMLTLNSSAVSGINGSFTIEDWFTCTTGWPKFDTLYSFSDGTQGNYLLATPVRGGDPWQSSVAMRGAGGTATGGWDYFANGIYLDSPGVHQVVATYDGTTLTYYVDGQLANYASLPATVTNPGFNLSTLTDIGINGGSPYGDPALTGSTYSFGIFSGALTAGQVSSLYSLGSDASAPLIVAAVPEPGSMTLAMFGGASLLLWRRRAN